MVAAGALTSLLELRGWKLALILAAQSSSSSACRSALQATGVDTYGLPAFGWGVGWAFAFAAVATAARAVGAEQRRFAQSALGKYLPPTSPPRSCAIPSGSRCAARSGRSMRLFTDLEGFTKLSHAIEPEQLSSCSTAISTC